MKIELNKAERHNVRVALRVMIKQPEIAEAGMKELLALSDKFMIKLQPPTVKKPKKKD